MRELALPLVFCEVAWMREMCPAPQYLLQLGDLALLLTSCSTPESGPAPHLAIKVELDLVVGGSGEPALKGIKAGEPVGLTSDHPSYLSSPDPGL